MSARIDTFTPEKVANKLFACHTGNLMEGVKKLNALLDEGWLVEEQQVVDGMYIVLLKQEIEPRKIVYVNVGDMSPCEVHDYVEDVRRIFKDGKGEDLFIPVRK